MDLRRLLNVAYAALVQNIGEESELDAFDRELEAVPLAERRNAPPQVRDQQRTAAGNRNADALMKLTMMPQVGEKPGARAPRPPAARTPPRPAGGAA